MAKQYNAVHVADTVRKAMKSRKISDPLVLHSERGSQYVSKAYLEAVSKLQLSYSKKGYPYDNACTEAFYNTVCIHSHCDYLSPVDFEKLYNLFLNTDLRFVG